MTHSKNQPARSAHDNWQNWADNSTVASKEDLIKKMRKAADQIVFISPGKHPYYEVPSMKYRKKPIAVEATQWFKNGDHPQDNCGAFVDNETGEPFQGEGHVVRYYRDPYDSGERKCPICGVIMHLHGWIDTLEGGHTACPGDWIITGVAGGFYPCKPDIFALTYEAVEQDRP